jgi:hypothetical protein
MREKRAIFYELPEGTMLTWLYEWFHKLRAGESYPLAIFKSPLGFFSESFKANPILRTYFKRFAGPDRFRIIEEAVQRYEHKLTLEDLVDSGMLVPAHASEQEKKPGQASDRYKSEI